MKTPVIDIHEHVVPRRGFINPARKQGCTTATELVAIMDKQGIDRMVALPITSPEPFFSQSVEEVFEACDQYPERFIKFCCVDPRVEAHAVDYDFVPILEYYKSLGARGVGEVTAPLKWEEKRVQKLLSSCEKLGLPVLFHLGVRADHCYGLVSSAGLPELEKALQTYPRLQFLAHSQTWWAEVGPNPTLADRDGYPKGPVLPGGRVSELMGRYRNLWGDLSAGSGFNAVSRDPEWGYRFLEEFQDHLLMGLDICTPNNDACQLIGFLRGAVKTERISMRAYEKIMGRNAVELLQLS